MLVDWLGERGPYLPCDRDPGYHCNANSSPVPNTATRVWGVAFIDCLEIPVSEIVSVSETRLSWEVRLAGVMACCLQMNFCLQPSWPIPLVLGVFLVSFETNNLPQLRGISMLKWSRVYFVSSNQQSFMLTCSAPEMIRFRLGAHLSLGWDWLQFQGVFTYLCIQAATNTSPFESCYIGIAQLETCLFISHLCIGSVAASPALRL